MKEKTLAGLVAAVGLIVALSGGGLAAPALTVSPTEGPIQTNAVLTGSGFEPGANLAIDWQTMVGNRVSGTGFAEVSWPLANVTTDASGNLHYEFKVPNDLGGPPHHLLASQGDTQLASVDFTIVRTAKITPSAGPLGTIIELHMTGGGWTQYDNIVAVTYDNAYIGYMCSFNTQGNMTTWFPASGGLGLHTIDVWPALYLGPDTGIMPWKLPHLSQGDQPWQPPMFHFEFTVTDMNGTVAQEVTAAPPASGDGGGPAFVALGAAAALVAAGLELPIRRAKGKSRMPATAAAALMLFAVVAVAASSAQAAAPPPGQETPIIPMATTSGPVLAVSAATLQPGEHITLTGSGLSASSTLDLKWTSVDLKAMADGEKFMGWKVTPHNWSLGTVATDSAGAFSLALSTPFDHGGNHQFMLYSGSTLVASAGIIIVPYFEIVGPTHVKAGEKVTVKGYGLGFEKYSASWNVAYDNRLTGWVSGMEAHGNVTFELTAVGAPGQHFIDIGEGAVGYPYLNLWESPFKNRPPGHLNFVIDASGGVPPPLVATAGASPLAWVLPLGAGVAVGAMGLQALRAVRISRVASATKPTKP